MGDASQLVYPLVAGLGAMLLLVFVCLWMSYVQRRRESEEYAGRDRRVRRRVSWI
jgi:hypothetical protein